MNEIRWKQYEVNVDDILYITVCYMWGMTTRKTKSKEK